MKKYLLLLGLLLPFGISAQTSIKEVFDGSSVLEWSEYSDKKSSALIQDGCMMLIPEKKSYVKTKAIFPIDTDYDFTIEAELFFPRLTMDTGFGLEFNDESFVEIWGWQQAIIKTPDGNTVKQRIKLELGKNATVILGLKRTATGCSVTLNNMSIGEIPIRESLTSPQIAFMAARYPVHIKSLTIEQ